MSTVETTAGPIDVWRLGFTLMHEHLFTQSLGMRDNWPETFDEAFGKELVRSKVLAAAANGVDTIVDLTPADLGRDVRLAAAIVAGTGVNLIVATGFWLTPARYFENRSADLASRLLMKDLTQGIQGTAIKAGVIKLACDLRQVTGVFETCFRAGARAHLETGAPISTHTNPAAHSGLDQQRLLAEEGVDLTKVVIGHSGDTTDIDYLKQLLSRGSYLGMDRFGLDWIGTSRLLTTDERIAVIAELCREGYARQLVLSHDALGYNQTREPDFEAKTWPEWNFNHVPTKVVAGLREAGVSQSDIDQMTRGNPRAFFERSASRSN